MKRIIQIIAVIAFVTIGAFQAEAQNDSLRYVNIAGRINDANTGKILRGVKIYNESRDYGQVSKNNGFYTLVVVTGDIIRFSHVGYEPVYMRINANADSKETIMIVMKESANYIEEVIVDADLPSESELGKAIMALDIDEDKGRELAEQNPDTFNILDTINTPPPGGPVSFLKKHVFDKIKEKKRKPGRKGKLPKYKKQN